MAMHSVLLKYAVVDARKLDSGSANLPGLPAWAPFFAFFEGGCAVLSPFFHRAVTVTMRL